VKSILPGASIGVLGSGQLGRMFAIAARRMGYRVHVLSPDDDTPTGQVADVEIKAAYDDLDRLAEFARAVRVVTFEFENVPSSSIDAIERFAPVRPAGSVLHTTQDRLREKTFLDAAGLPVAPFRSVGSLEELERAVCELGMPAVLKTSSWGYDGKGQRMIRTLDELAAAWRALGTSQAVLEAFVDFQCEVSVVAARGTGGEFVVYEPTRNDHSNHILDVATVPSGIPPTLIARTEEIARTVFEQLDVVGVICIEFFVTRDGRLVINELAPRPHNSGHLTIDANVTCQFEQQVRAVCGLPLGTTTRLRAAAMANLRGELWAEGEPNWPAACRAADVKLHLYGKREPRIGRKMGHLTALAATAEDARRQVLSARRGLTVRDP